MAEKEILQYELQAKDKNVQQSFIKIDKAVKSLDKTMSTVVKAVSKFTTSMQKLQKETNKTVKDMEKLNKTTGTLGKTIKTSSSNIDSSKKALNGLASANDKVAQSAKNSGNAQDKQAQQTQKAKTAYANLEDSIIKTHNSMAKFETTVDKAGISVDNSSRKLKTLNSSLDATFKSGNLSAQSMQKYENALKGADHEIIKQEGSLRNLKASYSNLEIEVRKKERALESLKAEYGANSAEAQKLDGQINNLKGTMSKLEGAILQQETKVDKLRNSHMKLNDTYNKAKGYIDNFKSKLTTLEGALAKSKTAVDKVANSIKSVGSNVDNIGKSITGAGRDLTGLSATAGLALGGVIKTGMSTEKAFAQLKGILGDTSDQGMTTSEAMEMLTKRSEELALTTVSSNQDIANGMVFLAQAGMDVNEIYDMIPTLVDFAFSANMDLATACDKVTNAMIAYNKEGLSVVDFLDVVAKGANSSNTSMLEYLEMMERAGSVADGFHVELGDLSAMIGLFANSGFKGSEAGRAFVGILSNINSGAGQAGKAIEEISEKTGINIGLFDEQTGQAKSLEQVFGELTKALTYFDEADQQRLTQMIAGKYHYAKFRGVLNGMGGDYQDLKKKAENAGGSLQFFIDSMEDTAYYDYKIMMSNIENTANLLFESIKEEFKNVLKVISAVLGAFNKLPSPVKKAVMSMIALGAILAPLLIALGIMVSTIGKAIMFLGGIPKAIGGAIGGVIKLVKAFSNSSLVVKGYVFWVDKLVPAMATMFGALKTFVMGSLVPAIQGAFGAVVGFLGGISAPVWLAIGAVVGAVVWMFSAFKRSYDENASFGENVVNMFKQMGEDLLNLGGWIAEAIGKLFGFEGWGEGFKNGVKSMGESISNFFKDASKKASTFWTDMKKNTKTFAEDFSTRMDDAKNAFKRVFSEEGMREVRNGFLSIIDSIGEKFGIVSLGDGVFNTMRRELEAMRDLLKGDIGLGEFFEAMGNAWRDLFSIIKSGFDDFLPFAKIKESLDKLAKMFTFDSIVDRARTLPGRIYAEINKGIGKITDIFPNFGKKLQGMFDEFGNWFAPVNQTILDFGDNLKNMWKGVKDEFQRVLDETGLSQWFKDMEEWFIAMGGWFKELAHQIGSAISQLFNIYVLDPLKEAWNSFKSEFDRIVGDLTEQWNSFVDGIKQKWNEFIEPLKQKWNEWSQEFTRVKGEVTEAWNTMCADIGKAWNEFTAFLSEHWNNFKTRFMEDLDEFKKWWAEVSKFFSDKWNEMCTTVSQWWTDLCKTVSDKWQEVYYKYLKPVVDAFTEAWDKACGWAKEKWDGFWSGLRDFGKWVEQSFLKTVHKIGDAFINTFNNIGKVIGKVTDFIGNAFDWIMKKVSKFLKGLGVDFKMPEMPKMPKFGGDKKITQEVRHSLQKSSSRAFGADTQSVSNNTNYYLTVNGRDIENNGINIRRLASDLTLYCRQNGALRNA